MINIVLPILFATIAAVGNAMFALGQKQSSGVENGLLFIAASALTAVLLAVAAAPLVGPMNGLPMLRDNAKWIGLSGAGLFLTYLGFNLLYARFGAAPYVLYASISIVTTSVVVGFWFLKESANIYHVAAIAAALVAVALFSVGQSRA